MASAVRGGAQPRQPFKFPKTFISFLLSTLSPPVSVLRTLSNMPYITSPPPRAAGRPGRSSERRSPPRFPLLVPRPLLTMMEDDTTPASNAGALVRAFDLLQSVQARKPMASGLSALALRALLCEARTPRALPSYLLHPLAQLRFRNKQLPLEISIVGTDNMARDRELRDEVYDLIAGRDAPYFFNNRYLITDPQGGNQEGDRSGTPRLKYCLEVTIQPVLPFLHRPSADVPTNLVIYHEQEGIQSQVPTQGAAAVLVMSIMRYYDERIKSGRRDGDLMDRCAVAMRYAVRGAELWRQDDAKFAELKLTGDDWDEAVSLLLTETRYNAIKDALPRFFTPRETRFLTEGELHCLFSGANDDDHLVRVTEAEYDFAFRGILRLFQRGFPQDLRRSSSDIADELANMTMHSVSKACTPQARQRGSGGVAVLAM